MILEILIVQREDALKNFKSFDNTFGSEDAVFIGHCHKFLNGQYTDTFSISPTLASIRTVFMM